MLIVGQDTHRRSGYSTLHGLIGRLTITRILTEVKQREV